MPEANREKEIFEQALDFESPKDRDAFIQNACAGDILLRNRIHALLKASEIAPDFLPENISRPAADTASEPLLEGPGTVIGRYKLLEQIGEGGFGVVYMAEQLEPVRRRVALKIIKPGMDSKQVIGRFEAERQALALMDHPNIAQVFDAGATEAGRPYFVMELVKGIPITKFCEEQRLDLEARLTLFIQVCAAVQHAHQKGIIHRDLKPTNILVTLHGDQPVPKVIDFGIAKATQQPLTDKTVFTQFQQFIGTPAYMSPEQATLSGLDVDTRSDIYSLGVLLYELLTGSPPFDAKELMSAGLDEMRRIIREKEPERPSTRLRKTSLSAPQPQLATRPSSLTTDLDLIVMKALEKDRARRYETTNGLAADLKRYLNNEPVTAVAPTLVYQLTKFYQRNRRFVRLAGAFGALLLVATVFSTWMAVQATRAKTEQSRLRVEADRDRVEAEKQRNEAEAARKVAADQAVRLQARIYRDHLERAQTAIGRGELDSARKELDLCDPALRHWEWRFANGMIPLSAILSATHQPIFLRDGNLAMIGVGVEGQSVNVWDPTTGGAIHTWINNDAALGALAVSSNAQRLATSTADEDGTIKLWNAAGDELSSIQAHSRRVHGLTFSPDDATLASSSQDGTARLWNVEDGTLLRQWGPFEQQLRCASFSPDGQRIVFSSANWTSETDQLNVWITATGEPVLTLYAEGLKFQNAVFSPDGRWIATSGRTGGVTLWNASTGTKMRTIDGISGKINALAFNSSGTLVAAGGEQEVRVWETSTAAEKLAVIVPQECWHLAFDGEDKHLAISMWTEAGGGETRIWDLQAGDPVVVHAHDGTVWSVAFSPDGRYVASGSRDLTVKVWDADTHEMVDTIPVDDGRFLAFDPDGETVFSGGKGGAARFWNIGTGGIIRSFEGGKDYLHGGTLSPNGQYVAAAGREHIVRIWDAHTSQLLHELAGHATYGFSTYSVAFSPDSTMLASADSDSTVRLWDVKTGRALHVLKGNGQMTSVVFSPDGKTVAAGSTDPNIYRWNPGTGKALKPLQGVHTHTVWALAYSPDGRRMASGDQSGLLVIWETVSDNPLLTLESGQSSIWDLAWNPDGEMIVSAGGDGNLRFWQGTDFVPGEPRFADGFERMMTEWTPEDSLHSLRLALALAWYGRVRDHEEFCRRVLDHATTEGGSAERAAKGYLARPGTDRRLMAQAVELAEKEWKQGQDSEYLPWYEMSLGLARYRQGEYEEALEILKSPSTHENHQIQAPSKLLQAMALVGLDRSGEARAIFNQAAQMQPPPPPDKELTPGQFQDNNLVFFWLLHAEAEALIKGSPVGQ